MPTGLGIKKRFLIPRASMAEMETEKKRVTAPALYLFTRRNPEAMSMVVKTIIGSRIAVKLEKNGAKIPPIERKKSYAFWSADGKKILYLTKKAIIAKDTAENSDIEIRFLFFKKILPTNLYYTKLRG